MNAPFTRRRLRIILSLAVVLLIATPSIADNPVTTGNGGFDPSIGWIPNPPDKFGFIQVNLWCNSGYTCGLTKVSIDWDDGTIETFYSYLPIVGHNSSHEYGDNGLRHIKVYGEDEDENGNWFDVRPLDTWINN
jgi:hypothetical protein